MNQRGMVVITLNSPSKVLSGTFSLPRLPHCSRQESCCLQRCLLDFFFPPGGWSPFEWWNGSWVSELYSWNILFGRRGMRPTNWCVTPQAVCFWSAIPASLIKQIYTTNVSNNRNCNPLYCFELFITLLSSFQLPPESVFIIAVVLFVLF